MARHSAGARSQVVTVGMVAVATIAALGLSSWLPGLGSNSIAGTDTGEHTAGPVVTEEQGGT